MTSHEHDPYRHPYDPGARRELRQHSPNTLHIGRGFRETNQLPVTLERTSWGSRHLLHHFPGVPDPTIADEAAVNIGAQAIRDVIANETIAWHELEAQQPHLVGFLLEMSTGGVERNRPSFLNTLTLDEVHNRAPLNRARIIAELLAGDRIIRHWASSARCNLSECPNNDPYYWRSYPPEGVPVIPLNSALAVLYDGLLYSSHWFKTAVREHVYMASDELTEEEREHFDWQIYLPRPDSDPYMMPGAARYESIGGLSGIYGLVFADSYTLVHNNIITVAPDEPMPAPRNKGSH